MPAAPPTCNSGFRSRCGDPARSAEGNPGPRLPRGPSARAGRRLAPSATRQSGQTSARYRDTRAPCGVRDCADRPSSPEKTLAANAGTSGRSWAASFWGEDAATVLPEPLVGLLQQFLGDGEV